MEAVQLFQIYRVCNLKASQITTRRIMMTLVYFSKAHSGFDWIPREAMVFFLAKSCYSPTRFMLCYQGTWLIMEHSLCRFMGCSMGSGQTFFFFFKMQPSSVAGFHENVSLWGVCSMQLTKLHNTNKQTNILQSSPFSSFKHIS